MNARKKINAIQRTTSDGFPRVSNHHWLRSSRIAAESLRPQHRSALTQSHTNQTCFKITVVFSLVREPHANQSHKSKTWPRTFADLLLLIDLPAGFIIQSARIHTVTITPAMHHLRLPLSFKLIALLAITTLALPQNPVHVFTDGDFGGAEADLPLADLNGPNRGCQTLGDGWERSISSLKIDSGVGCTFYATGDCTDGAGSWEFSSGDTATIPIEANDRFSSYQCLRGLEVVVTPK